MPRPKSIISSADVEIKHDPRVMFNAPPEVIPPFDAEIDLTERNEANDNYHKQIRRVEKLKAEKFGNDLITIQIEDDDDPNSPKFVFAGHQGLKQYIFRGQPQTVKRKYVASFLAGKRVSINAKWAEQRGDEPVNHMSTVVKGTYRVTLIEDNNPEGGMRWFQKVMAMPV